MKEGLTVRSPGFFKGKSGAITPLTLLLLGATEIIHKGLVVDLATSNRSVSCSEQHSDCLVRQGI